MKRKKPIGDIAQAVIDLMADPARWRSGLLCVRHEEIDLVVWNGCSTSVRVGPARFVFEGRDERAVDKAYEELKEAIAALKRERAAQQVREALIVPPAPQPARLPPPEPIEELEARVRRLRQAVLQAG